jgi:hypothetical protein
VYVIIYMNENGDNENGEWKYGFLPYFHTNMCLAKFLAHNYMWKEPISLTWVWLSPMLMENCWAFESFTLGILT